MITPTNRIRTAIFAGSVLYAGTVTPICTAEAGGDEEGESAEVTEPEASAATIYLFSQIKSIDIVIAVDSLLP